jgi:hypothetical protein
VQNKVCDSDALCEEAVLYAAPVDLLCGPSLCCSSEYYMSLSLPSLSSCLTVPLRLLVVNPTLPALLWQFGGAIHGVLPGEEKVDASEAISLTLPVGQLSSPPGPTATGADLQQLLSSMSPPSSGSASMLNTSSSGREHFFMPSPHPSLFGDEHSSDPRSTLSAQRTPTQQSSQPAEAAVDAGPVGMLPNAYQMSGLLGTIGSADAAASDPRTTQSMPRDGIQGGPSLETGVGADIASGSRQHSALPQLPHSVLLAAAAAVSDSRSYETVATHELHPSDDAGLSGSPICHTL